MSEYLDRYFATPTPNTEMIMPGDHWPLPLADAIRERLSYARDLTPKERKVAAVFAHHVGGVIKSNGIMSALGYALERIAWYADYDRNQHQE